MSETTKHPTPKAIAMRRALLSLRLLTSTAKYTAVDFDLAEASSKAEEILAKRIALDFAPKERAYFNPFVRQEDDDAAFSELAVRLDFRNVKQSAAKSKTRRRAHKKRANGS